MERKTESIVIAQQTLVRLPYYVRSLTAMKAKGLTYVSAPMLAKELQLGEVQVRKDLSAVSVGGGKPKLGFSIEELLKGMRSMLGCDNGDDAVLVGAGDLGHQTGHGGPVFGLAVEGADRQRLAGGQGLAPRHKAAGGLVGGHLVPGGQLGQGRGGEGLGEGQTGVLAEDQAGLDQGMTPDAVLTDVEAALERLGELTGRAVREDVVDRIFSRFCVGK